MQRSIMYKLVNVTPLPKIVAIVVGEHDYMSFDEY